LRQNYAEIGVFEEGVGEIKLSIEADGLFHFIPSKIHDEYWRD